MVELLDSHAPLDMSSPDWRPELYELNLANKVFVLPA